MRTTCLLLTLMLTGCASQPVKKKRIRIRIRHDRAPVIKRGPPPLQISTQLNNRFTRAAATGEVIARVRIRADRDLALARAPVNLGLVVDTSGSMAGKAIAHARKAALAMVRELKAGDRISIVVFNSETRVLVPSTVIDGESRAVIEGRIASMKARGTTDMAGGLSRSITEVRRAMRPDAIHRVVLLSDGMPNDEGPIGNLARYAQRSRITITALGLGLDFNETLLGTIARTTGGTYQYIRDPAQVARVFRDQVIRMRQVIAQQLSLRILPGPGVTIRRVLGRAMVRHGRYATVHLGGLRAGEQRDVLIQLSVPARRAGATLEIMDGRVAYVAKTHPRRSFSYQHKFYLSAKTTADPARILAGRTPGFALPVARALAAQSTVDAIALARARRLREAIALLDRALAAARLAATHHKDKKLAKQVLQMVKLRAALPTLVPRALIHRTSWKQRRKLRHRRNRLRRYPRRSRAPKPVAPTPASADTVRKAHSSATRVLSR